MAEVGEAAQQGDAADPAALGPLIYGVRPQLRGECLMAFSELYLMRCFDEGLRWAGKETALGDWYVHLKSGIDVVSTKDLHAVRFSDPDTVFIPDTDDLLEVMENQIAASGVDPSQKKLRIGYEPDQGWWVEVEYGGGVTQSTGGESVHTALLNAVMQIVASDPARRGPVEESTG